MRLLFSSQRQVTAQLLQWTLNEWDGTVFTDFYSYQLYVTTSTEDWEICWYHDYKETGSSAMRGGNLLTR